MDKVMLIDGHSIINRAFYAMPVLTNKNGLYTNAVLGFMNMFYKFIEDEQPDFVGVAFDVNAPTRRHEQYAVYKGNRKPMPNELRPQIPLLKELLQTLNITMYELAGYEADDILGTLAKKAEAEGFSVVIVSGDKDLLQVATKNVRIKIPKTKAGKTEVLDFTENEVIKTYGVTPTQFIDVKALMGDASDNIPGVTGIGEKTAVKIITEFKTLQNALENATSIKPKKAGEKLVAEKDIAILSKSLATIDADAPVELEIKRYNGNLTDEAFDFLNKLEFKSIIKRFAEKRHAQPTENNRKFTAVNEDFDNFANILVKQSLVSYSVIEHMGNISGISFSFNSESGYFVEMKTPLHLDEALKALTPFFADKSIKKITCGAKQTYKIMSKYGIYIENMVFDVNLAGYVLDPTKNEYTLDSLMYDYLGESVKSEAETLGKGKAKKYIYELDAEERLNYCATMANGIYRLYDILNVAITENGQNQLYYGIEMPLISVLFDMEQAGIRVNVEALIEYGNMLAEKIDTLTNEIYELMGKKFNINSPKQLGEILFEDLGLTSLKKTKTGYSTNIEELERLKTEHPAIEKVIEYRTLAKLKSTYADGLLAVIDKETGKLHTTFNQAVTATGRLSSTEPNLQNIPVRIPLGRQLRKVFVPDNDEYVFVDADYSQIELRVLAHLSEDEKLIEAFKSGLDIHRLTASQVNNMPYELITPGLRNAAKAVNFGIIYGISAYSLSVDLGITKKEAEKYINAYFAAYPKIKCYLDGAIASAKQSGCAKTIMERKRPMPELNSDNYNIRSFGERVAMNMPIQGSAADIIKIAMIKVNNALKEKNLKSKMLLQVHDELLIMAYKPETEIVKQILKNEMESAVSMLVPLTTDIHVGETWLDAK